MARNRPGRCSPRISSCATDGGGRTRSATEGRPAVIYSYSKDDTSAARRKPSPSTACGRFAAADRRHRRLADSAAATTSSKTQTRAEIALAADPERSAMGLSASGRKEHVRARMSASNARPLHGRDRAHRQGSAQGEGPGHARRFSAAAKALDGRPPCPSRRPGAKKRADHRRPQIRSGSYPTMERSACPSPARKAKAHEAEQRHRQVAGSGTVSRRPEARNASRSPREQLGLYD